MILFDLILLCSPKYWKTGKWSWSMTFILYLFLCRYLKDYDAMRDTDAGVDIEYVHD